MWKLTLAAVVLGLFLALGCHAQVTNATVELLDGTKLDLANARILGCPTIKYAGHRDTPLSLSTFASIEAQTPDWKRVTLKSPEGATLATDAELEWPYMATLGTLGGSRYMGGTEIQYQFRLNSIRSITTTAATTAPVPPPVPDAGALTERTSVLRADVLLWDGSTLRLEDVSVVGLRQVSTGYSLFGFGQSTKSPVASPTPWLAFSSDVTCAYVKLDQVACFEPSGGVSAGPAWEHAKYSLKLIGGSSLDVGRPGAPNFDPALIGLVGWSNGRRCGTKFACIRSAQFRRTTDWTAPGPLPCTLAPATRLRARASLAGKPPVMLNCSTLTGSVRFDSVEWAAFGSPPPGWHTENGNLYQNTQRLAAVCLERSVDVQPNTGQAKSTRLGSVCEWLPLTAGIFVRRVEGGYALRQPDGMSINASSIDGGFCNWTMDGIPPPDGGKANISDADTLEFTIGEPE